MAKGCDQIAPSKSPVRVGQAPSTERPCPGSFCLLCEAAAFQTTFRGSGGPRSGRPRLPLEDGKPGAAAAPDQRRDAEGEQHGGKRNSRANLCGAPVEAVWRVCWQGRGGGPRDTVLPERVLANGGRDGRVERAILRCRARLTAAVLTGRVLGDERNRPPGRPSGVVLTGRVLGDGRNRLPSRPSGAVLTGRVLGDERNRPRVLVDQLVRPWIERAVLSGRAELGLCHRSGKR